MGTDAVTTRTAVDEKISQTVAYISGTLGAPCALKVLEADGAAISGLVLCAARVGNESGDVHETLVVDPSDGLVKRGAPGSELVRVDIRLLPTDVREAFTVGDRVSALIADGNAVVRRAGIVAMTFEEAVAAAVRLGNNKRAQANKAPALKEQYVDNPEVLTQIDELIAQRNAIADLAAAAARKLAALEPRDRARPFADFNLYDREKSVRKLDEQLGEMLRARLGERVQGLAR